MSNSISADQFIPRTGSHIQYLPNAIHLLPVLVDKRGDCIRGTNVFTDTQILIISSFELPRGGSRRRLDKTAVG